MKTVTSTPRSIAKRHSNVSTKLQLYLFCGAVIRRKTAMIVNEHFYRRPAQHIILCGHVDFPQSLFNEYSRVLMVNVDNVGSKQMQQIRISLRGKAIILMGKNTTIRKAMRGNLDQNPQLEKLLPYVKGNVGFVFTNDDLQDIREIILANQVS